MPLVFLTGFYAPLLLAAWCVRDLKEPGQSFEPYRNQVVVLNTTIHYSRTDNTNIVSTMGYLRNDSPYSWKAIQLEVQYFNRFGKLVDTETETLRYQELPPRIIEAFRVRAPAACDESSYVSSKVFVRTAKDARKIWNDES
jgi:hypothetical protein